jgi:eukaryotic-like serine/threonine-protein kinase
VIQVGDVLRGRYRIDSSIGRGGMGEVFAAVTIDPSIVYDEAVIPGRRVAVKVVSRNVIGELLMARLQREAIAAARVKSDFVPQLLDVDTTDEGEVFLVMELLRGQTMAERMRRRGGSLTWDELEGLGEDVLRGLVDAHAAGVIHRDLKPSNIFIEMVRAPGGRERAKILDFGVCKLDTPDEEKLTTTGESVGTVAYMAPEQVRGASRVDQRADLYSFASVVFEALAGRLPHEGPGQMAMLASKLEKKALRLKDVSEAAFPPQLDPLIAKLLKRKPDERYASAAEVLGVWATLGPPTTEAPTLPIVRVDTHDAPPFPTQTSLTSGTMTRMGRRPSRLGVGLGVGAVVVSGAVLALMVNERRPAPAEASGPATASSEETVWVVPSSSDIASPPRVELPATDPAQAIELEDADTSPSSSGRPKPTRPGVRWTGNRKPPTSGTGEPHISDKPRY